MRFPPPSVAEISPGHVNRRETHQDRGLSAEDAAAKDPGTGVRGEFLTLRHVGGWEFVALRSTPVGQ